MLTYTGCRISEALALTADRVDFAEGTVIFETLKKRRPARYRAVPVPPAVLDALDLVHDVRQLQRRGRARGARLWPWHRATAWRRVVAVMRDAGLNGPQATPKGLRHGFGVAAVNAGIPLNMVQDTMLARHRRASGLATRSSAPRSSTRTPWVPRSTTSRAGGGPRALRTEREGCFER